MSEPESSWEFAVRDYDLAATLGCGQAFRWRQSGPDWIGTIGRRWVRLLATKNSITALTRADPGDWSWLRNYLQLDLDLDPVLKSFPDDQPIRAAVSACRGLRLLRQDPWECLASFILSSTKQIVQIQQVIDTVCRRFGSPLPVPARFAPANAFPTAARLARTTEAELRSCKMGFRAPYLLAAARAVATGALDLAALSRLPLPEARARLTELPGVGRKIADCVLLFACGFPTAFPLDVWVLRALRALYFPNRKVNLHELIHFSETHFGPYAGYAQQYLFHYMRTKHPRTLA